MNRKASAGHLRGGAAVLLLLLLVAITCCIVVAEAESASEILHLYPETPRHGERLRCGVAQLYRVHDLAPTKVYDVKVSYPASIPTDFILEVDQVLVPASLLTAATTNGGDGGDGVAAASTMAVRRLNTAKLRLHPQELLLGALRKHQQDQDTTHKSQTYRLDLLNGAAASELLRDRVALDISLRADVEGVSPVIDPSTRECVFDIVVEEMLLGGAFPYDTLALIAWLVLLLALALKWVYPYLLRKIALELPEERLHVSGGSGGNIKRS